MPGAFHLSVFIAVLNPDVISIIFTYYLHHIRRLDIQTTQAVVRLKSYQAHQGLAWFPILVLAIS